jgi:hypothetical protein
VTRSRDRSRREREQPVSTRVVTGRDLKRMVSRMIKLGGVVGLWVGAVWSLDVADAKAVERVASMEWWGVCGDACCSRGKGWHVCVCVNSLLREEAANGQSEQVSGGRVKRTREGDLVDVWSGAGRWRRFSSWRARRPG